MKQKTTIRKVHVSEIDCIAEFCVSNPGPGSQARNLKSRVKHGCVLAARQQGRLTGVVELNLSQKAIKGPWIQQVKGSQHVAHRLLVAAERLAAQYGITQVKVQPASGSAKFFNANGYSDTSGSSAERNSHPKMARSIIRRTTRFGRVVRQVNEELGIPADYGANHKIRLQPEAKKLSAIGEDIYGRKQRMTRRGATAWRRMVRSAKSDGVIIQPVSAYRSVEYQAGLVRRKIEKGQSMKEILAVSAAPGYSEHHTGCAIDVTTPGFDVLEENFENSPAFEWLCNHAVDFNFNLSFPKNNIHGIAYEPWHWCWRALKKDGRS